MKGLFFFFFESVGVAGGSPELGIGNPGWVPSTWYQSEVLKCLGVLKSLHVLK